MLSHFINNHANFLINYCCAEIPPVASQQQSPPCHAIAYHCVNKFAGNAALPAQYLKIEKMADAGHFAKEASKFPTDPGAITYPRNAYKLSAGSSPALRLPPPANARHL